MPSLHCILKEREVHFQGPCHTVGKLFSQRIHFELNG